MPAPPSPDFNSIPVIDLEILRRKGDGQADHADLARGLHAALKDVGFAYLVGHGVPTSLRDALLHQARAFFARPMAEKQAIAINRWHRGYMAPNSSLIVTSSVATVEKPNQSESFMALHRVPDGGPAEATAASHPVSNSRPLDGPNQWPAGQPGLEPAVMNYMAAMEGLARQLVQLIALGLGLPADHLATHFDRPTVFLRLLHYPPQRPETGLFGSAPHTDYGFLTLLAQDEVGGLEVRNKAGRWIPAPPLADAFVLNVGDILSRWSGGRLASTPHRVRNLSIQDRYSFPFFFDPDVDTVVSPLLADPGGAFTPVRYGDYLMERLDKNYAYRKGKNGSQ
ncbi:MAG: 2-oxoglutarate and iron-dependent oxygenase domain-containing protein [Pseudomonadota bacterium]